MEASEKNSNQEQRVSTATTCGFYFAVLMGFLVGLLGFFVAFFSPPAAGFCLRKSFLTEEKNHGFSGSSAGTNQRQDCRQR